jgi:hypothetical protein
MKASPVLCDASVICVGVRRKKGIGGEVAVMWKGRGVETEASSSDCCLVERMCSIYC